MAVTLGRETVVGVLGAGSMGSGIAQVAAAHGHRVILVDADGGALERARAGIRKLLDRDVAKNRLTAPAAGEIFDRIRMVAGTDLQPMAGAGLVIEAIVEDLDVKRHVLAAVARETGPDAVIATNTSSLSITAIAAAVPDPERVIGIHFFNPATLMPLVEIVPGHLTAPAIVETSGALIRGWRKTTVVASDTPGFIVNRVARPFYGEALRILEEGIASAATIDWAMRELGGFRMGPFELMDLIGNDVNYAVTRTVFEAFGYDPRYRPSLAQKRLVDAGLLGRKSGRGWYDHAANAPPAEPAIDRTLGQEVVHRVLAMLINEAADALFLGVASVEDLELAMTTGVNYPKGLLAWADELGPDTVLRRLETLHYEYGEDRYRPSPMLRRVVREGRRFTP